MTKKISLSRQLITCAILCTAAVFIIIFFHPSPTFATLFAGLPLALQLLIGAGIGMLYWASAVIGNKYMLQRQSGMSSMIASYGRLDLSGWNPLWMALAAGIGEELLFRGALQPLLGIWITSLFFVVLHIRAYQFNTINRRVLVQAFGLFAVSVLLGYIAREVGLLTAMLVHTSVDIVGLYTIRRMMRQQR